MTTDYRNFAREERGGTLLSAATDRPANDEIIINIINGCFAYTSVTRRCEPYCDSAAPL